MSEDKTTPPASDGAPPAAAAPDPAVPAAETQQVPDARAAAPAPLYRGFSAGLLIAILALGLTLWHWTSAQKESIRLETELARKIAEIESSNKETRLMADEVRNSLRDVESRMSLMDAKLTESENQRIALESLYQELARNRDEWVLAEIEQILIAANQQIQLAGNIRSALIALQAADSRLAQADRPNLLALRRVINNDIDRLKAAPAIDIPGLVLRIDKLINVVDELPLVSELSPSPAGQGVKPHDRPSWDSVASELWADLKDMLRIRFTDSRQPPLLSPDQAYFVRENLRLKLLSARLSALSRDENSFRTDLTTAGQWLNEHFDMSSKAVSGARTQILQLAETDLAVALPDIGDSLQAVRRQLSRPRVAPR